MLRKLYTKKEKRISRSNKTLYIFVLRQVAMLLAFRALPLHRTVAFAAAIHGLPCAGSNSGRYRGQGSIAAAALFPHFSSSSSSLTSSTDTRKRAPNRRRYHNSSGLCSPAATTTTLCSHGKDDMGSSTIVETPPETKEDHAKQEKEQETDEFSATTFSTDNTSSTSSMSISFTANKDDDDDDDKKDDGSNSKSSDSIISRRNRRVASGLISAVGFLSSSTTALMANREQIQAQWKPTIEAFRNFVKTSGIELELSPSLNLKLLDNIILLAVLQRKLMREGDASDAFVDRRDMASATATRGARQRQLAKIPTKEESYRYMKYATAVYGDSMISASEMGVLGKWDNRLAPATKTRISDHIGVPEGDIVLMDVDFTGDSNHLRHFIAVDHENKKVVFSIRGTFSLSEVIVDVAAFSRHFCGGEAHAEMATMAERTWKVAGETIRQNLRKHEDYEFIITGHSLGASAACLLNIMCHRNNREAVLGRKIRCFAFASAPCYTPIELAGNAVENCVNHIFEEDVVPFLSVDSVRHAFASIRAIEDEKLGYWKRKRLIVGTEQPSERLLNAVDRASKKRLPPKKGAPVLIVPAGATLWIREKEDNNGAFEFKVCDSRRLSMLGILLHPKMFQDHFPSSYEDALHYLE